MKINNSKTHSIQSSHWSTVAAFSFSILAASPVWAADFPVPDSPLQTGARAPANLMLVLDDSGSMADHTMPETLPVSLNTNIVNRTYTLNTIYYNPNITYLPWRKSVAGTIIRLPETPITAVYPDDVALTGSCNLLTNTGCVNINEVRDNNILSFHVPLNSNNNILDGGQYYRYLLKADGTAERRTWNGANWNTVDATYSATSNLSWTTLKNGLPVTVTRTVTEEFQNFANWYSFHRTRNKVAKAGASEAFADLGDNIRVGFNTIWNRDTYPIPVNGNDEGRFIGNNRDTWYIKLQDAIGSGFTPLRTSLSRTGKYYQDINNLGKDGPYGPLIKTEDAPNGKLLTCRQNFTIFTTDGYWNGIDGGGGEGPDYTAPGDADSVAGVLLTAKPPSTETFQFPANTKPFADNVANTLADVAMYFWKTDLRTDMDNDVPNTTSNKAFWQHMVTFGISIGIKGTLDKTDLIGLTAGNPVWTNPITNTDLARIDDLFHASVNSKGEFVAATNAVEFATALKDALAAISGRIGSSSNVAANSVSVGGNTRIFQAKYITGQWTGELSAFPIVGNTVGTTASWKFTDAGKIPVAASRKVFTIDGTTGATFPTSAQQAFLTADIADYIRGDQSKEISNSPGTFRNRNSIVGDIVNSSPAYINETTPSATAHETVFISSNDGMLHAINAATGVERFAYVPGIINLTYLKSLAIEPYTHKFLVDGPVVVSTRKQTPGYNYLVGSLGRGGKGLFALDVTDPDNFSQSKVLWEKGGSDADMGKVISRPIITKANNGEQVVIVSNGLNSTNGNPVLMIYNLQTGVLIRSLTPNLTSAQTSNGLSAATGIDNNIDGKIDYVYAGDIKGNIWKFDLSSTVPSNWKVAYKDGSNIDVPIFSAKDSSDKPQPITGGIAISFDASLKPWVFFGTGSYLTLADIQLPKTKDVQTWYGIRDEGTAAGVVSNRSTELKKRAIVYAGYSATLKRTVRAVEPEVPGDMKDGNGVAYKGWYMDLINPPFQADQQLGERIVGTSVVRGERLLVSSITPSLDPCNEGRGFINEVGLFTGANVLEGKDGFLDANGNGYKDDKVTVNGKEIAISSIDLEIFMPTDAIVLAAGTDDLIIVGGSQGGTGTAPYKNTRVVGRISWHELINN